MKSHEETIQSWTAEELIKEVWHELNQKSSIALGFSTILADEENYGFTNEKQKEVILHLQETTQEVRDITMWMFTWFHGQKEGI